MVLKAGYFISKLLFLFFTFSCAQADKTYTLKFATLIPPDTAWVNSIQKWSDELKTKKQ